MKGRFYVIQQFEMEHANKLQKFKDRAAIVQRVYEKVLESHRDGMTAGQKGTRVIRNEHSRRRGFVGWSC